MSKFFRAFEQAERDRSLRDHVGRLGGDLPEVESKTPETTRDVLPHGESSTPRGRQSARFSLRRLIAKKLRPQESGQISEPAAEGFDSIDEHLVSLITPTSFEAEQYQTLRQMIEQRRRDTHSYVVAVASPAPKDGKTLTAINLAGALAMAREARVLLMETDLRRSSVADYLRLGSAGTLGLVDAVLDPTLSLEDVVKPRLRFNLEVLPAGRLSAAPYEVLRSPCLGKLLEEARRRYDYVVLDTPPLVPFPDCRLIERWIDGFLVVVAAHKTPRKLVEEALNVLDPAKMIGFVFNNDDRPMFGYRSRYYYGYDQALNGGRMERLSRAVRGIGSSLWRRRAPRQRKSK
jgi:protein-tyrosine kinase